MALSPSTRRLLVAIVAWPAGVVAAIAVLIVQGIRSDCVGGEPCALEPTSWIRIVLWLAIAFGPGVVATRNWWTKRGSAT